MHAIKKQIKLSLKSYSLKIIFFLGLFFLNIFQSGECKTFYYLLPSKPKALPMQATNKIKDFRKEIPIIFEKNRGQSDKSIKFLSMASRYNLLLTESESIIFLKDKNTNESSIILMKFNASNKKTKIKGISPHDEKYTYLLTTYENIYNGIDLIIYGDQEKLGYDFIVSSFAKPEDIQLSFLGVNKINLNDENAIINMKDGKTIEFKKPSIYQNINGIKKEIQGQLKLENENTISFQVDNYNKNEPLIIDPVIKID